MVEMGKKTGGHFLWEPLRTELQDTFGALSHVASDSVFSNIHEHENNPNSLTDDEDEGIENAERTPPEAATPKADKSKKQSKNTSINNYHILHPNSFFQRPNIIIIVCSSATCCATTENAF